MRCGSNYLTAILLTGTLCTATAQTTTNTAPATTTTIERLTTGALIAGKVPGVKFEYDVPYLPPDRQEKLDVYLPAQRDKSTRSPAILMIHGGGWKRGVKDARRELQHGTTFARAGYVAVSVEYLRGTEDQWPQNLLDCKNAVRWLRANADRLQVDPDNIGVIGGSAGGHLALMVAYTSGIAELQPQQPYPGVRDDVQAVVNLYGITDLHLRRKPANPGDPPGSHWAKSLLNDTQVQVPEQWKLGSPVHHVTSATVPTFILHGDQDKTVHVEHGQVLADKLRSTGAEHQVQILAGAPHSFLLHDRRLEKDLRPEVIEFFDTHLK